MFPGRLRGMKEIKKRQRSTIKGKKTMVSCRAKENA
jgi:hypothetical protein